MPSLHVSNVDGDTLVAAPSSMQFIRVIGGDLTASAQSVVSLKSDTTVIWDTYAMDDPNSLGGIALNVARDRTIDCAPGKALKLGVSTMATVKGSLEYIVLGLPDPTLLQGG